ncbi:MAG: hypothetical protein ABIP03_06020 [Aquihabitans sp.]
MAGGDVVKALWLRQPYPTLIAIGVKGWETRSCPPNGSMRPKGVRGLPGMPLEPGEPLAIVASKSAPKIGTLGRMDFHPHVGPDVDWCGTRIKHRDWYMYERPILAGRVDHVDLLPLGEVVCTVTVPEVVPMVHPGMSMRPVGVDRWITERLFQPQQSLAVANRGGQIVGFEDITDQLPYGDWEPGRWAWRLDDVTPVEAGYVPVVTRGNRQGLCEIEVTW